MGLHAEEREAFPDLQAGQEHQAPRPAEEGVVVLGRRFGGLVGPGVGHGAEQRDYSWSYQVSRNIPVSLGRCAGDGKALTVIES